MLSTNILELRRQAMHLFVGFVLILLLSFDLLNQTYLLILLIISILLSIISLKVKIPGFYWFLEVFERRPILTRCPGRGVISFIAGSLLVLLFFEKNIALASILILTIGDSLNIFIGQNFGKLTFPWNKRKKIFPNILVGVIAGLLSFVFVNVIIAIIAGMIAMVVESFNMKIMSYEIDDNLIIPPVAALVMYYLIIMF